MKIRHLKRYGELSENWIEEVKALCCGPPLVQSTINSQPLTYNLPPPFPAGT